MHTTYVLSDVVNTAGDDRRKVSNTYISQLTHILHENDAHYNAIGVLPFFVRENSKRTECHLTQL
jgi:hypothetical protein